MVDDIAGGTVTAMEVEADWGAVGEDYQVHQYNPGYADVTGWGADVLKEYFNAATAIQAIAPVEPGDVMGIKIKRNGAGGTDNAGQGRHFGVIVEWIGN